MPTYDYECSNCGYTEERFLSMQQSGKCVSCPECSGSMRKIISGGAGVIYKCHGFYTTDNRGK